MADIPPERPAGRPTTRPSAPDQRRPAEPSPANMPPTVSSPRPERGPRIEVAPLPPETSPGPAQTIMLGLGSLLLGIAAITFVGAAFTGLDPLSQLVILLAVAAMFLAVPPPVAARGLGATAESLAAVGLVVTSVAGYPLWSATGADQVLPATVYVGLVAAATAGLGYGYSWLTRLAVPQWAALVALQPVLPLLAGPVVTGPAGWGLVFTLVAAQNLGLALAAGRRPLGLVAWALHGLALLISISCSAAGLLLADAPGAALPAAGALLLAGVVAAAGGLRSEEELLLRLGTVIATLTVLGAGTRLVALALPGRSLLPIALVVAGTALAVRASPAPLRPGPRGAVIGASSVLGVVVAGLTLHAGLVAVVWPAWPTALPDYPAQLAAAAEWGGGWQLAATAAAATVTASLVVPHAFRRELTVAGAGLAIVAIPASFGLSPSAGAWVLVVGAAGLALTGVTAATRRAAVAHLVAAGGSGLLAVGVALAAPVLTAGVLAALTLTGVVVAGTRPAEEAATPVTTWSAGAASLTLPAAAATTAFAAGAPPAAVLAATYAAVCASLGYAAVRQLRERELPIGIRLGTVLATVVGVVVTAATDPHTVDIGLVVLLVATGLAVTGSTQLDALRRPDRRLDASDLAAAAVTVVTLLTLARITTLLVPLGGADALLATAAGLVLLMAVAVRTVPTSWRRGPVVGLAALGTLVVGLAAPTGLVGAARALTLASPWWRADLTRWRPGPTLFEIGWSAPFALALLALAAALVLPVPIRYRVTAPLVVLATLAAGNGFGLPWWAPTALATLAGAGYALLAVGPPTARLARWSPRTAAWPRAAAALTLFGYAVAAAARPETTAATLTVLTLVGLLVAGWGAARPWPDPRRTVGGAALTAALMAFPAGLAALTGALTSAPALPPAAALAGTGLGLALVATLPTVGGGPVRLPYPGYVTVGVTVAATGTALASLPTTQPTGVYAAAAVLLTVLAELLRAGTYRTADRQNLPAPLVSPPIGALLAAAAPATVALVGISPALAAALVDPYHSLTAIWRGPQPPLLDTGEVPATSVLAVLLITLTTALAAVGFGGVVTRQIVPLTLPGLAVTLLITPAALGAPWPVGTLAALAVFTLSVLGVALTPPPPRDRAVRPLRAARMVVLGTGLLAGGAGLAGSLADPYLTWGTCGGGVAVGLIAAFAGRTGLARLTGWLGAATAAQLFALTTAALLGATAPQAAFGLLVVAALGLLVAPRLPGLRSPTRRPEQATVEGCGGYLPLLLALGLVLTLGTADQVAALLVGGGAVLGLAGLRPGRLHLTRRLLWWTGALAEVAAWWILIRQWEVGVIEAYTLPFALFALVVGVLETRYRPELSSWVTHGPGLVAAFGPSLVVILTATAPDPIRHAWVILGGAIVVVAGSRWSQRAPLIIGAVVTAAGALHLLSLAGPWLVLIPVGLLLLVLGANREKRARDLARLRGVYSRMR